MIDNQNNTAQHYAQLKNKWTARHREIKETVAAKHSDALQWALDNIPAKKHIAATALAAALLLTPSSVVQTNLPYQQNTNLSIEQTKKLTPKALTVLDLATIVPRQVRPLTRNEEKEIANILSEDLNMNVKSEMNGIRLNRNYGLIGAEQHLVRYPGDVAANHVTSVDEYKMFFSSGIAPGKGAWGYFTNTKNAMTQKDIEREKYYIAVPTFLAPGFNNHVTEYKEFFKYRKMLVVNPKTGSAVVTDIADAGPGQSTGKHLGGSPEVMHHLDFGKGPRKGAVLYFFIEDPDDKIPLGPIQYI